MFRRLLIVLLLGISAIYAVLVLALVGLRWINPPTTAVQVQRRMESWWDYSAHGQYRNFSTYVPLQRISPNLQHAVIAAEDSRFYTHHGFDWTEIRNAMEDDLEEGRMRGASTLTQQLIKNLFLTTRRSVLRKAVEASLVPVAEMVLGKRRILELYLNVVEWAPGVYGAEAAAHFHYGISAARVSREQAARLAAVLPSPRRRKPARMNEYTTVILTRMSQMGW